ncbi:MAG TPA: GNAT family N-acetyltransferase [Spirochaetota bacterium]|nr:GNAT family N-acetyltransferase [Spirochaetota bacterium]HOM87567.1 GNAT family N-acetyltransferase [Spirochaetota bacterium]HOR93666.1 GNAT family N-acetyltransferase [Spirochaetota bacterium]HOT19723.1 GNAT family N-acetyltransferase [Spirochaetota bacterium]HPK43720.1 GNAT family N-acetyltransferase [Spirochaetota bacterium]
MEQNTAKLEDYKRIYPEKFLPEEKIFSHINRGDRIFIGTACSEPQYLVNALVEYVKSYPKAFFDTEVIHVWTLGVAPYADEKFKQNFRHNSFFIGMNTRNAVNKGIADYTPIFLSRVPQLLRNGIIDIDVALVQTSYPDEHGYLSLGVSVDIVKTAVESARLVVVQVNKQMPRVHGDAFIHIKDVDFIVPHDEEILEFTTKDSDDISNRIGKYVSLIIQDGDTIQVGYGRMPNAILKHLIGKKNLGVHTELISDGIVELMKAGVVTNSEKTVDRGKTIASFCMGTKPTYEYIHDNPSIEFKTIDYTNNPLIIAQQRRMTAINAALQIDLTGQATAESLGKSFFSGIGGQADFMRGAILAPGGKSILALRSTTEDEQTSRIVPFIPEGAGITLNRGDVHYVVTEYGIAYIHGKNIRERAMDLIAIAHPKFRPWLIEEAKKDGLIYRDQAFIPGKKGEYPEHLETFRTTKTGIKLFLRPAKISDEELLKDFFYSLSDQSLYRRFISTRKDMPHERLQEMVVIDYTKELVILAVVEQNGKEVVVGVGQYGIQEYQHWAEVAFAVRDDYQYKGIGQVLLSYLTLIAKRNGLLGFTAEVLVENKPMLHLFEKMGFNIEKRSSAGVYELKMEFRGDEQ